jgi:hypothetical protein
VTWFHDVAPEAQPTTELAQQPVYLTMAREYGPQAGLTFLAIFSLFMVFRIAKKAQTAIGGPGGSPAAAGAWSGGGGGSLGAGRLPPLEVISNGPSTVGEVGEVDGIMVGHEVDEGLVRTQQIINQINQLVKDDPTAPASIIEGWIQSE